MMLVVDEELMIETIPCEFLAELAAIAEQAFDVPFLCGPDQALGRFPTARAATPNIRLAPIPSGTRIELAVESEQREFVTFRGDVPEAESPALRRIARLTQLAMQQRLQLAEQDEQLSRHTAQVSHDFDMLVSMRELAERMQHEGPGAPAANVVESLLPCLRDMLRASEVLFVESAIESDDKLPACPHLTLVHRFGQPTLDDAAVLRLLTNRRHAPSQEPVVLNDGGVGRLVLDDQLSSAMLVAMSATPGTHGWLLATRTREDWLTGFPHERLGDREFGTIEAGLLKSVATFLSSHSRTVQLFQEQEHLLVGVVRAMVNAIDAKDSYTCGHSDRVAVIARLLACELGLSEVECDRIYLTGLLHDIGKIGVPDSVLLKDGKLTDEEFALIKKHPVTGFNVLSHLDEIAYVLPGVLHHHESLDGRGYPSGLRGIEIPLDARILAVADAFDAMTSDRPYRKGMSLEKASGILQGSAGVQWDANVVAAFFSARDKIVEGCHLANTAISEGAIHYHDDNIARAVLSVRAS